MSYNVKENARKFKEQEIEFANLISDWGEVCFSTRNQDMKEHWDVKLVTKLKTLLFDVKAMKKINREDNEPNENIHYIELKNVQGKPGWLYGKADCFAFEMKDQYIVVDKEPLQEFITNKCKDKITCIRPELYKLYRRDGRKDLMVLVETSELIKITRRIVLKDKTTE